MRRHDHGRPRRGRALSAEATEANATLAMTTTLAPCLPLPVHSNCSQVPAALQRNVESCMHISFQPGGYGQGARKAELTYQVEPALRPQEDADAASAGENGLTMVLLVGSPFYFEDQTAMYEFLQPRLAAALQEAKGYDPTLQGPCIGGRQEGGGVEEVASVARRRRRRRLQEQEEQAQQQQQQQQQQEEENRQQKEEQEQHEQQQPALPSCARVVDAFNSLDIAGGGGASQKGDARSFAL